jgi:hypothetical protein
MQYLRARYYNPASGTFNRLDPFFGNMRDPQSLHKYLYVHGDPIQGIDPTGRFATVLGLGLGFAWAVSARQKHNARTLSVGAAVGSAVRILAAYWAAHIIKLAIEAGWTTFRVPAPATAFEGRIDKAKRDQYVQVIRTKLMTQVWERYSLNGDVAEWTAGRDGAKAIANAYVDAVIETIENENNPLAGILPAWAANSVGGTKCRTWAGIVSNRLTGQTNGTGWSMRTHYNSRPSWCWPSFFLAPWPGAEGEGVNCFQPSYAHHSFVSITYHEKTSASGRASHPDWVLDPWGTRLPDVYEATSFHQYWPLDQLDPLTGQDNSDIDMDWPSNP